MNAYDIAMIIICATAVTGAVMIGVNFDRGRRRKLRVADLTPEPTPIERPTLNPANRPLVRVLVEFAAEVEMSGIRTAGGLRDIARVLQLSTHEPTPAVREKIASFVEDHGDVFPLGAQRIREAGQ